jgi:hypothetical protein
MEKEQRIVDLERELKEVRDAAAAEKKRLEDELARRSARSWRLLRNLIPWPLVGRIFMLMIFLRRRSFSYVLTVVSCRVP